MSWWIVVAVLLLALFLGVIHGPSATPGVFPEDGASAKNLVEHSSLGK